MRATIVTAGLGLLVLVGCSHRTEGGSVDDSWREPAEPSTVEELVRSIGAGGPIQTTAGIPMRVEDVVPIERPEWSAGALTVDGAWVSGDMGSVRGFGSEPYRTTASYDGTNVNVTLFAEGAVMAMINIGGFPELELGRRYEFDRFSVPEGAVYVSGLACAGPEEGVWTYDQSPEEVVMAASADADGAVAFQLGFQLATTDGVGSDWAFAVFELSPGLGW